MYTPANEYEERVPVTVIRLVAQKSGADRTDPARLMADINHVFAVEFPYTYSDVNYRSIAVPEFLKLDCLVKLWLSIDCVYCMEQWLIDNGYLMLALYFYVPVLVSCLYAIQIGQVPTN